MLLIPLLTGCGGGSASPVEVQIPSPSTSVSASAPTSTAGPTAPVTASATPSGRAALPYQADWSTGMGGWTGSQDWKAVGGMLVNDGSSYSQAASVTAPDVLGGTSDYTAEADIQLLQYVNKGLASFGLVVRSTSTGGGYGAGHC